MNAAAAIALIFVALLGWGLALFIGYIAYLCMKDMADAWALFEWCGVKDPKDAMRRMRNGEPAIRTGRDDAGEG